MQETTLPGTSYINHGVRMGAQKDKVEKKFLP